MLSIQKDPKHVCHHSINIPRKTDLFGYHVKTGEGLTVEILSTSDTSTWHRAWSSLFDDLIALYKYRWILNLVRRFDEAAWVTEILMLTDAVLSQSLPGLSPTSFASGWVGHGGPLPVRMWSDRWLERTPSQKTYHECSSAACRFALFEGATHGSIIQPKGQVTWIACSEKNRQGGQSTNL